MKNTLKCIISLFVIYNCAYGSPKKPKVTETELWTIHALGEWLPLFNNGAIDNIYDAQYIYSCQLQIDNTIWLIKQFEDLFGFSKSPF